MTARSPIGWIGWRGENASRHHVRVSGSADEAAAGRLAALQSLTDSTIGQLDVDDLLVELLVRIRVILDVDTAAVLFLNEQADALVARAACGIEDEVRQG